MNIDLKRVFSSERDYERGFKLSENFGIAAGAIVGAGTSSVILTGALAVAGKYVGRGAYNLYRQATTFKMF